MNRLSPIFKHGLFLLTIFCFFTNFSFSQFGVPPPGGMPPCADNDVPGNTVCTATPICNINGYCGQTSASYTVNTWPQLTSEFEACTDVGYDHGSIENNSFLSFVASSNTISFDTYVYGCTVNQGIQLMIFSAADCQSGPVTAYACAYEYKAQSTPHNFTATGLTPGDTYYIMIDGYSGKVCDYTFVATEGVALPLDVTPGPTINLCHGEEVEVTATGGSGAYLWDAAPGLSSTTGSQVTITAPSTDGTYTYTVHSDGGTAICPESDTYDLSVIVAPCCNIDAQVTSTTCDGPNGTYDATLTVSFENPPSTGNLVINACDGSQQVIPVASLGSSPYITTIPNLDLSNQNCSIEAYFSGSSNCTHVLTYTPNASQTPTFTNPGPVCPGTSFTLSTTSNEGVTGTWLPAVNNTQTTLYTFTPTAGSCAVSTTMTVVIEDNVVPTFTNPGPVCTGTTFTLPTTSSNGVTGTWSPPINTTQTTLYTFTPIASGCATSTTMTVVVEDNVVPTFTNPGPVCSGTNFTLPTTSNNGITGTWSPSINATQTTLYTFTPTASGCATSTTMSVVIEEKVTPTFTNPGPICPGTPYTLPTASNEGIAGTWSPAIDNSQTTVYTFTPASGECATISTITVVVSNNVIPTFTNPGPICSGDAFSLPTTSNNGVVGTWSPAVNNTQTTTYTFTPATTGCAVSTTLTVVISDDIVPTFVNPGPICPDSTYTLPSTSTNGVSGTWSPAVNNLQTTTYTFTPTSSNCAVPTTMTVEVDQALCIGEPFIEIPNVFTPNGDNVNDFYVINTELIEKLDYWILNRWGDLIYQSDNLTSFWNGKVGGNDAAEGVYFIKYKATGTNGKVLEGHSFFHLER